MKYFRLTDDVEFSNRWYLAAVKGVDNWALFGGQIPDGIPNPLEIETRRAGQPMDFTLTGGYMLPVVSTKLRAAIGSPPGITFLEASLGKGAKGDLHYIMVIEPRVECVDESRSEFEVFTPDDPVRPDLAGEYSGFFKLVIDKMKAAASGQGIFRLARFDVAIIVSAQIKSSIEAAKCTGARFDEV